MLFYYIGLIIIFIYIFYHLYWKRRNFPPGPMPLPFIGNLFQLIFYGFEEALEKFHENYGDIHTIWIGDTPVISVNDFLTIEKEFIKNGEAYAGRESNTLYLHVSRGGPYGITMIDGTLWKNQKKFALNALRNLGVGKDIMQQKVIDEVNYLIEEIKEEMESSGNGREVNVTKYLDRAVGNIINSIAFGFRFGKENQHVFKRLKDNAHEGMALYGHPLWRIMENGGSFYQKLPLFKSVYQRFKKCCNNLSEYLEENIQKQKEALKFKNIDEPENLVEAFLKERQTLEKNGIMDHEFSDIQLNSVIFDMWVAGQESSATTLDWIMLYMAVFPEVQQKIHKELEEVIGNDRIITLNDKNNLPYLNAVITESQRYSNFAPFNLIHRTLKNVKIHGFEIPENTSIVSAIQSVQKDERYFEEPKIFNPNRFLDAHGKFFSKPEFIIFGVGKRACLGEGLAKVELFLFTANILNQFKISQVPNKPISMKRIVGGTVTPEPYVVDIKCRW